MMEYKKIKEELKDRRNNTRYFTKQFYDAFMKCRDKRQFNIEHDIDDSYYAGNVLLFHCYDEVYNSDFYNKNSGTYCEFLSIVY